MTDRALNRLITATLTDHQWAPGDPTSAHANHNHDGRCALCRADVDALAHVLTTAVDHHINPPPDPQTALFARPHTPPRTPDTTRWPVRVRVYGGRATHAAAYDHKNQLRTACGRWPDITHGRLADHPLPPSATITCAGCLKKL